MRNLFSISPWGYFLFATWNAIFLTFMLFGFLPLALVQLVAAVQTGVIPPLFILTGVALAAMPLIGVVIAFVFLRDRPKRLLALGYGIEGPVMLLLGLRFFILRDITLAQTLLITLPLLGMPFLLWLLIDRQIDERGVGLTALRLAGTSLLLLFGIYAAVWIAFYVPPVVRVIGEMIGSTPQFVGSLFSLRTNNPQPLAMLPFMLLGGTLALYSATLFAGMPIAVPVVYFSAWQRSLRAMARLSPTLALGIPAAVLALCAGVFLLANEQPQGRAFALLKSPPVTPQELPALVAQEHLIRSGLLNAYLAPNRYVSAVGDVTHVRDMYRWAFGMRDEDARLVQSLYEFVARPLLYEPVAATQVFPAADPRRGGSPSPFSDIVQASDRYQQFFDTPIAKGEREVIVRAMRSTWLADQAMRSWQSIDDREILLTRQDVSLTEHGDWADVELYEVYQNQTRQRQEVVYYFSLPESAVVTGVWLGNNEDRASRFEFRVSPRGTAQSLYRNEVRVQRDPALVEQIGPRQYRLRVFPIEPGAATSETNDSDRAAKAPLMHLWLTYRVPILEGQWRLPQLAEKLNVYWDSSSVRTINGMPMEVSADTWLPASVPAVNPSVPQARRLDFPAGVTLVSRPATAANRQLPAKPLRLAVVVDRSRSMAPLAREMRDALARVRALTEGGYSADVYLTSSPYRGEAPSRIPIAEVEERHLVFFGGQDPAQVLVQFTELQGASAYDAVLVLTDDSAYEMGAGKQAVKPPSAPLWMIHIGGKLPLGYDDPTLTAIQASGGGIAATVDEALARIAAAQSAPPGVLADLVDGTLWYASAGAQNVAALAEDAAIVNRTEPYAALAARQLILAESRRARGNITEIATLDRLHALASEQRIVTPYSSMIVLVNDVQRRRLDELEKQDDRFQREKEDIANTTPEELDRRLQLEGVPEPHEWLLIGVGLAVLAWYLRAQRRRSLSRRL